MRLIEETQLRETILLLNKYQETYNGVKNYYNNFDDVNIKSLQSSSIKKDIEFFDEIAFILSVIATIISRPQISNKGEDIIIRADLAGHISPEAFKEVFKDSTLWKEKNLEMIPEYIHYHQYTDELRIYENIFIGMLIKKIDLELTKYKDFYISLIPAFDNNDTIALENQKISDMLKYFDKIERRLKHIKNSYFYREISKCNLELKNIQPTNILVKNRLYNYCYKFYKKFILYIDYDSILMDLRDYTKSLILKVFKKNNFILDQSKSLKANDMSFAYNDFKVNLSTNKNEPCIFITVKYHNVVAKHQLFVALDLQRQEYKKDSECISSNVMTIWNLYDFNSNIPNFKNRTSEVDMLEYWIMDKFKEINASKNLYEKYCPICKGKNVDNNDNVYICSDCNSIYTFKNNSNKNIIWFLTYRR